MKVLIADDHDIIRKGLRQILQDAKPECEITEVADGQELLNKVSEDNFDLIISDITMPVVSGLEALKILKKEHPHIPVLILSIHAEELYATRALKSGAHGYLTKAFSEGELLKAVNALLEGKKYITPVVAEQLSNLLNDLEFMPHHSMLSDREFEVFKLIAMGYSITDIANAIDLNSSTVRTYRARILEKMKMKTAAEIIRYAIEHKIL